MPLQIEDEDTGRLARRLAEMTGETITAAVTTAIRGRLDRLEKTRSREGLSADVHAISDKFRQHAGRSFNSLDHSELLYDERGLPK